MRTIDGSRGEGGGQVLRTALAVALCRGVAVRIEHIRAGRPRPGLARQHLAAVRAAAEVGGARVEGDALGSGRLVFHPGAVRPGRYRFDVGTAGSATLVLQTVLPALITAAGPSDVTVVGGTHNPWAPPYPFLRDAFLPLVARMGPKLAAELERPGFFPKGGGRIRLRVTPAPALEPLELTERGGLVSVTATAVIAGLPRHIAERELAAVARVLDPGTSALTVEEAPPEAGPGNAVWVTVVSERVTEVFTAFGMRGVRAEDVGEQAAAGAALYLAAGVPVGPHLADQLLLPMALGGGGSFVTSAPPSGHTRTNADVIGRITGARVAMEPEGERAVRVTVTP